MKGLDKNKHYGIFDIDGTLSSDKDRRIFLGLGLVDEYNRRCSTDQPKLSMLLIASDWVKSKNNGAIILTGRSDRWMEQTINWLTSNQIYYDKLIMRPHGLEIIDYEFKRQEILKLKEQGIKIRFAFDDKTECTDAIRKLGIPCFLVLEPIYDSP